MCLIGSGGMIPKLLDEFYDMCEIRKSQVQNTNSLAIYQLLMGVEIVLKERS